MSAETLEGILAEIRYHEDGFLVGKLDSGAVVKGQMLWPEAGMGYVFKGYWENHPRFGRGFKFEDYDTVFPTSLTAIREYLEENAEGIGPKLAEKLTETFGDQTLIVLKNDPAKVATTIPGITEDRAKSISTQLKEMEARENLCLTLKDMVSGTRLPKSALNAIILLWKEHAPEMIKANPYELMERIDRVGFTIADAIARKVGYDPQGFPRIRAGVIYTLRKSSQESGHVFLPRNALFQLASELLALSPAIIEPMIPQIAKTEPISIHIDEERIYLSQLYEDERLVANKVKVLLSKPLSTKP